MDKFVTRPPSWKTKVYSNVAMSAGFGSNKITGKFASKGLISKCRPPKAKALMPLQEGSVELRLSPRDERLLKIFTSEPDEPLVEYNASGSSSCSSSSHSFPSATDTAKQRYGIPQFDVENTAPSSQSRKNLTELHEPADSNQARTAVTQQEVVVALDDDDIRGAVEDHCSTPHSAMLGAADTDLPSTPPTLVDNRLISRIHRDLNSPSASVRVRALKAIHNPSKSAYAQFDVPHAEQSLITAEERNPPPPKSIEELMRDIIVYVEVRTGEDNRSTGVKKVISALGAKVNDKLLRDTTHVIFKDGLLSTYKKAKNWNIPVVSILWIEACKTQRRICDPNDFPISNVDRYENPELYEKMKRHKSMQPDSEANKRVRAKANNSTPKNATPRNGALKRTSTFSADTPTSAINTKNDISRFFTQLSSSKSTPIGCAKRILGDTPATPINGTQRFVADFPTTQASEKLDLNDNTLIEQYGKNLPSTQSDEALPSSGEIPLTNEARKLVDSIAAIQERTPRNTTRASIRRRSTMRIDASIEATTNCVEEMSWEQTQPSTPATRTRRRSSIHLACNMKFSKEKESFDSAKKNQHIENVITEEAEEESTETVTAVTPAARSTRKRKTTYTPKPLELTGESRDSTIKTTTTNSELQQEQESVKKRSTIRRRTLFTSHKYAESPPPEKPSSDAKQQQQLNFTPKLQPNVEKMHSDDQTLTPLSTVGLSEDNLMQTTPQQTGSLLEQHAAANIFSSTRAPGRRRTLFDVSMDIITQRLQNINRSARRSTARPIDSDLERLSQSPIPTESISTLLKSAGKQNRDQESHSGQEAQQTAAAGDAGCSATTATSDASSESSAPAPKKKRKLFVPNECLLTPPSVSSLSSSSLINAGSKTAPNSRRRRTLMPLVQPQVEPKIETTPITSSNKSSAMQPRTRRSTMDFEDIRNSKSALSKLVKEATNDKKTTTAAKVAAEPNKEELRMKRDDNAVTAPLITLEKQKPEGPFLVYTNMRKEQVEVIKEAVEKLGHFQLEDKVSNVTTHVVSLEPRRTMNMLRALLRGLWILEYAWIKDSLTAGRWVSEEPYEMRDFSRAVEICRSERQAFGKDYTCELFSTLGPFYVTTRCGTMPRENLRELIQLCGGKVVDQRKRARYILGDVNGGLEDKIYITPQWIVDSITAMQLQRFNKYPSRSALNGPTAASQPIVASQPIASSQPMTARSQNVV